MSDNGSIRKIDEVFSSPAFTVNVIDFLVEIGQIKDEDWKKLTVEEKLKWVESDPDDSKRGV